jgi:hypothetical protein
LLLAQSQTGFYTSVSMTARYELSADLIRDSDIECLIFAALRKVINRHAPLGVSIRESSEPCFFRLPRIDLREVTRFSSEPNITSFLESAHRMSMGTQGELPLWRVIVMTNKDIAHTIDVAFLFDHAICDGLSGFAFHHELLHALYSVRCPTSPIVDVPQLSLFQPIEEAYPLPPLPELPPANVDEFCWSGARVNVENQTNHLRIFYLSPSILEAVLKLCRDNNVAFTSLFNVSVARFLSKTYPEYSLFRGLCAMSSRRFTGMDNREMVNYVEPFFQQFSAAPGTSGIQCGGKFTWNAVRECDREIKAVTAGTGSNHQFPCLSVQEFSNELMKFIGKRRLCAFSISNVGVFDQNVLDRVQITRVTFSQSIHINGAAFQFTLATVIGGELAVALTWQEGVVEVNIAEQMLYDLEMEFCRLTATHIGKADVTP